MASGLVRYTEYVREGDRVIEVYVIECKVCGKRLLEDYPAKPFVYDCEHYYWEHWGNKCYSLAPCDKCQLGLDPSECNQLFNTKLAVAYDGTSVYTLHKR